MKYLYTLTLFMLFWAGFTCALQAQCTGSGSTTTNGSNNVWRGYVYTGTNFNTYKGRIAEGTTASADFDEDFGGDYTTFSTNSCNVTTDNFSVRFRLRKNFTNGYYTFTVGGDDGYRLSVDGGSTWIINEWNDQGYNTASATVSLNGNTDLVLEYYENTGSNRISFSVVSTCVASGNGNAYGNNNVWQTYMYQGTGFQVFKGAGTHGNSSNPNFDTDFGGANINFSTGSCNLTTEAFSVRMRLQKNFIAGTYMFTVGGDDGYRLSLDGGATWVINNWNDQSYSITTYTGSLSGTLNLVLEYYENGGDNRLSFAVSAAGSLPVKLTDWSATALAGNQVQLSWKTTRETAVDHFTLLRSTDGRSFEAVQHIKAVGNSTIVQTYSALDQYATGSTLYYKLASVDEDGSVTYSGIVAVSPHSTTGINIYPTVVTNNSLYIESGKKISNGHIQLYDMNGRLLMRQPFNPAAHTMQQVNLRQVSAKGNCVIKITEGNYTIVSKMIIVQ
jgi:hypothetical protein